ARLAPIFPPPAIRTYTSGRGRLRDGAAPRRFRQHLDRVRGRADRAHPLLGGERSPRRVEQPNDHTLDPEPLLDHLADDDVRVVAVCGAHDGVGILDSRAAEARRVHAVADDEAAVPALAEPAERLLLLVDRDDVPAL